MLATIMIFIVYSDILKFYAIHYLFIIQLLAMRSFDHTNRKKKSWEFLWEMVYNLVLHIPNTFIPVISIEDLKNFLVHETPLIVQF